MKGSSQEPPGYPPRKYATGPGSFRGRKGAPGGLLDPSARPSAGSRLTPNSRFLCYLGFWVPLRGGEGGGGWTRVGFLLLRASCPYGAAQV